MAKLVRENKFISMLESMLETNSRRLIQEKLRKEGKTVTQVGKDFLIVEELNLRAKTLKDYLFAKGRI